MTELTGATRVAALIGSPVRHSLSPAIHNAAFAAADLDWAFVAFDVAAGGAAPAIGAMRALGLGGLSVTMPHKADVAAAVDRRTPVAERLGAVNTVFWDGDALVGDSTDGAGFVDALRQEEGVDLEGLRVAVLGAGGAARAVIDAVALAGAAEVLVVNRTEGRGHDAAALAPGVARVSEPDAVETVTVVVNATSVGMRETPGEGQLPLDPARLHAGQIVVDLVYNPRRTPLLDAAAAAGARPVGGVGMLVHQAAHAFTRWTGREAPLGAMRAAVLRHLDRTD